MRQVRHSGVARNDGTRALTPGLETGAGISEKISDGRGLTTHFIKSFYYVGTNNRISTIGTSKFARDGPGPSYAIRFAFGMLPLLIYETILCFPILWKAIQNYGNGYGSSILSDMVHDRFTSLVSSPFSVLTSPYTDLLGHVRHIATGSSKGSENHHGSRSGSRFATLDSVLILSDVRVTDEVFNSSWALLASSVDQMLSHYDKLTGMIFEMTEPSNNAASTFSLFIACSPT
ncbi:hypothetical protein BU17DRAFT_71661 [Hysterangium stoloniferum]|nr:hypothetical protein BU17DRAFT_71661 [Hysterangium stoloniferum]